MAAHSNDSEDFEMDGNFEKDLLVILRQKSPRFNELIDKQVSHFTMRTGEGLVPIFIIAIKSFSKTH